MPPPFPFLRTFKDKNQNNYDVPTSQSQDYKAMGNTGSSKKKLRKPGPNRIVTNPSDPVVIEPLFLKSSKALDDALNRGTENSATNQVQNSTTNQIQHDLRQRPAFPPPYTPSHNESSKYPPLANSIISGRFLSEGSRYPQFTPSQARSWTVPSVRRASFPEAETYEEQIEDESWVNNQTQSSHNLARQMRDPRISEAPTGATIGQDETFHEHEQFTYQPRRVWRQDAGDGPFGVQEIDENIARRQGSQRSNRPRTHENDTFVTRRQGSQRSNQSQESDEFVDRRQGSQQSNRQRTYETPKSDVFVPRRQGSQRSHRSQEIDALVERRQGSQRSNRPQEIDEIVSRRQGSQRSNRPQEGDTFVPRRQRSQRSNRLQESEEIDTRRHGSQRSNRLQEVDENFPRRHGSQSSNRTHQIDDFVTRSHGSSRSTRSQEIDDKFARRQRSQRSQSPETIEATVFERDYGTEDEYEPEIYNYIVPAGLNVVFQDEDGNIITRVGKRTKPYDASHPVKSAPIIVHDEFGRELYRTKYVIAPPKPRPDLFNAHMSGHPTWEDYGFGSGGRINTHDSGQHHRPPWLSMSRGSMTSSRSTKTIMVDEKGNQIVLKTPSINRDWPKRTEEPLVHDISYRAQIDHM